MAKSNRTCYFVNYKEFWTPRPMRFQDSNKKNKVICHRIERAWKRVEIYREVQMLE